MEVKKQVDQLYHVMQSIENKLGGGEGIEGIYGSITQTGMQKVFDVMSHSCGFDKTSTLVDIGAGLGRPLLHACIHPGVTGAFGIELDKVKVSKAEAFTKQCLAELVRRGVADNSLEAPEVQCSSVELVKTLNPATHAYSFWEGVPFSGKEAFGRLFAASTSLKAVTVVQRAIRNEDPAAMMQGLGFGPLLLIKAFPVKMSGSGRSFQAYVFSKITPSAAQFILQARGEAAAAEQLQVATDGGSPCSNTSCNTHASAPADAASQQDTAAAALDVRPLQLPQEASEPSTAAPAVEAVAKEGASPRGPRKTGTPPPGESPTKKACPDPSSEPGPQAAGRALAPQQLTKTFARRKKAEADHKVEGAGSKEAQQQQGGKLGARGSTTKILVDQPAGYGLGASVPAVVGVRSSSRLAARQAAAQ